MFMDSSVHKPSLILLGGDLYDFPIHREEWEWIVAADRGAAHALKQDVAPDYVVGDFDPLSATHYERVLSLGLPITRLPTAKDLTDGEAAVDWALEKGARLLVLAGGLGGRIDHTLGNLFLLQRIH